MRISTPAGIGAFLAHLGLQTAEGIGAVVGDVATAVTLGGCPPEKQTKMVRIQIICGLRKHRHSPTLLQLLIDSFDVTPGSVR